MVIIITCGPAGAGLFLVDGDGITPVTHPAASGQYGGLKQARGALARLLAGLAGHGLRPAGRRGPAHSGCPARTATRAARRQPAQRSCGQPGKLPGTAVRTS